MRLKLICQDPQAATSKYREQTGGETTHLQSNTACSCLPTTVQTPQAIRGFSRQRRSESSTAPIKFHICERAPLRDGCPGNAEGKYEAASLGRPSDVMKTSHAGRIFTLVAVVPTPPNNSQMLRPGTAQRHVWNIDLPVTSGAPQKVSPSNFGCGWARGATAQRPQRHGTGR